MTGSITIRSLLAALAALAIFAQAAPAQVESSRTDVEAGGAEAEASEEARRIARACVERVRAIAARTCEALRNGSEAGVAQIAQLCRDGAGEDEIRAAVQRINARLAEIGASGARQVAETNRRCVEALRDEEAPRALIVRVNQASRAALARINFCSEVSRAKVRRAAARCLD